MNMMSDESLSYLIRNMERKIDRHSITYHLITHINVIINEMKIIRKSLNTSDLTHSHPSI